MITVVMNVDFFLKEDCVPAHSGLDFIQFCIILDRNKYPDNSRKRMNVKTPVNSCNQ